MLLALLLAVWAVSASDAVFSYEEEARNASIGEFPWMALLMNGPHYRAGATVVSRFYVVTLCKRPGMFKDLPEPEYLYSNYRVVAGTISIDPLEYQGTQLRWIYYWEDHPKCRTGGDTGYWTFDISVIKVTQQFVFNELVKPMPFVKDQAEMRKRVRDIVTGKMPCSFAGWGAHKFHFIDFTGTGPPDYDSRPWYYPTQPEGKYCVPRPRDNETFCDDEKNWVPSCPECFPRELRVIEMSLMDDDTFECENSTQKVKHGHKYFRKDHIYRRHPPVDVLCAIGAGVDGDTFEMERSGVPCTKDFGNSLVCHHPDGPVVVGHLSYANECNILWADFPTMFARYDWEIHPWIMQFYSESMFSKHWVDPVYPFSREYCPNQPYAGPIPPKW